MKKFAAVLFLALILPVVSTLASADTITLDFSSYTTEELIQVFCSIREELLRRTALTLNDFIGRGTYTTGNTIAAGTYRFLCTESGVFSETGHVNNVITVEDSSGKRVFRASQISVGGYVTFTLSDGDVLEIAGCSGTITKIDAPSWAP